MEGKIFDLTASGMNDQALASRDALDRTAKGIARKCVRSGQRLNRARQPRELTRNGVAMHDADARATMHLGLRRLKRFLSRGLVAARDRGFHGFDVGSHATKAYPVDFGATRVATYPLLGGLVMSHLQDLGQSGSKAAGVITGPRLGVKLCGHRPGPLARATCHPLDPPPGVAQDVYAS